MIKCALTKPELEFVYGLTKQSIQAKLDAGNPFIVDNYMKYLYERIEKVSDRDRAAQFLAFTPTIVEAVVLNNFTENIDQIEGYDKISVLKAKWANPNTVIKNVVSALEQNKTNLRIARIINQQQENIKPDNNGTSRFNNAIVPRYRSVNILSTTLPAFKSSTTKFEKEVADTERRNINNIISGIALKTSLEDTVLKYPNYQGVNIRLKAVNLGQFVDGTYSASKLDSTTQKEIARSLDIQNPLTKGKPKTGVDQVQDRVIVLITDESGAPLSFDAEGNIVTEVSPNSTFAYQLMRSVRKEGNNYSIRDIYNLENKVLDSSEIANILSEESDLSYNEALTQTNLEFKRYYALKNKALDEDIFLDFIGMTEGISIEKNTKKAKVSDLIENNILSSNDLESIRTLVVDEGRIKSGHAAIDIKGETYAIDRPRMSNDLATQIENVLFSKDISIKDKLAFSEQYIENKYISSNSKRHDILIDPVSGDLYIKVYDRIQSKKSFRNTLFEVRIDSQGNIFENETTPVESKESQIRSEFKNALLNTFPDGNSVFLTYSEKLLREPFNLKSLENGKLKTTIDYIQFIENQNPVVYIASSEKGFYNKQILFQETNANELTNIPENLPLNERFNQLTEEEYLGDLLLKQTPDGKSILKDEYKGKLIYSTLGLFSEETFKDTEVVHTNDITLDLIPSIQTGDGEVFRERNENESIQEYILAFSKTGYKQNYLDPAVTNRIKQLTEQGVTVVTETSVRIKDADLVVLGNRNNPAVESYDLKESFFTKELNAAEEYLVNLTKEPVSKRISPYQNKQIVVEKATSVDTDISNDPNNEWELLRDGKLNSDKLSAADIKRADTFWSKSPFGKLLQKNISLNKAANLVNSDAFANFVISGATLMNPDIKGTININNSKGSLVDVYHEAFHAFTQLYLTKDQKTALYEEVLNYTDNNGNKPYEGKSYLQIEEILAEDFRSYMKKNVAKPNSPMRNTIFRKIVQMLQRLLGKIIPSLKNVQLDIMSVPAVKELYENLNFGSDKFFNQYQASVDNARFFELERGITYSEKINDESFYRTALSKTDSDLISSSIDSIISNLIDERYELEVKKTTLKGADLESHISKVKGLSLTALLEPKHRVQTYKKVLDKLKDRLGELNTEYNNSVGKSGISEINTFKELTDASVATLETKSGINKYVLLKSQIDNFKNFDSSFKRGARVRGEEWKGIKIVGDYFTHSSIKDNSREGKPEVPAQIIIVSRIEDAQTQYNNYKKGGAKEYIGISLNEDAKDSNLTYDQENLLGNIRILETAIDQFGDPNYILDEQKPTGVIAYHIKNSNFEIDSVKYTLDEVPSSENNDKLFDDPFKKSLLDLADKEVLYVLKSLHKIENGKVKKNKLGFDENADFRKVWNTLSKVIGGVQSRQEMFDIIVQESKNFPELKQLWQNKLPAPSNIESSYAFDISSSFWHTFSRPSIKHWQLTANINIVETSDGNSNVDFEFITNESTIELNRILSDFENRFKISKNKYMLRRNDQPAVLDTLRLYNELVGDSGVLSKENKLKFLNTLGFKLDNTKKLENALQSRQSKNDISNLVNITKDVRNIILKPNVERTELEKRFVKRFSLNPIRTLRDGEFIAKSIGALPSFQNVQTLRADSIVRNLGNIQASFGFDTPGDTIKLPDGNNAYSVANHSSASSIISGVNVLSNLEDAYVKNGHLSFLNPTINNRELPYNPLALRNKILNTMFPNGSKRDSSKEMELIVLGGTETITSTFYPEINYQEPKVSDGLTTGDLTAKDKLFQAYNMLLSKGVGEFIRHSDKKTAFGIKIDKRKEFNGVSTGTNSDLWIDIDLFTGQQGDAIALEAFILDQIANEFDRIQYFSQPENKNVLETTTGYNRTLSNDRKAGLSFIAMDSLIPKSVKTFLYQQAENPEVIDIKEVLRNSDFFNSLKNGVTEYFRQKTDFIKKSLGSTMLYNKEFKKYDEDTLAKAYVYNDFINRLEMSNLLNGDLAQFKDFTKRVPGSTSDGDSFLYDKDSQIFINKVFQGKNVETYAKKLGFEDFNFDGTLNTGVIKDPKRESIYLKDMQAAWTKDYENDKLSKSEIADRVAKDSDAYLNMEEADGAAYLTLDAYRVLRKLANKWSVEQENLYQDVISKPDVKIDSRKVSKFFPVYKLHNYGSLMNAPIATTSMYKFAVAPIIPSIATPGSELYKLHKKMIESDIQMVTFKSGSKAANLVSKPGQSDDIFAKLPNDEKLNRTDKYVEESNDKAPIKNNKIHLRYLKDVTNVADKLKGSITVGTQSRVIVESQLYSRGELVDKKNKKVAAEYRKAVKNLTDVLEKELLDDIGFKINNTGRYVPNGKNSLAKLAAIVRSDLDAKGSPIALQNLIDVTTEGSLKIDFSIHPEAQVVEQILVNRISKAISGQKTKGESDVQVPNTFYNGVWSSQFEQDAAVIKNELEIEKKLGTNTLPFYRKGKDGTHLAKVAIPFNGDFLNLLNLDDPSNPGEIIGTRDRLNELLKDENWLKDNAEKITITGPRIPTDDTNLVEGFEVWHFLDATAGSTAVVPTEIVAKAGSDFDVDKLFFSFPNINKDGSLPSDNSGSITEQKRFNQNELIRTSVEILKLPELYGALTKPANTYLFKSQAKAEPTNYRKVHSSLTENPTKFFEYEYNNTQHDLLMGGSTPLGIFAKNNKQFILNMAVGAKMPLKYLQNEYLVRDMRMRFKHNDTPAGNILISKSTNVDGVKISEILSHGLQGVLDRGNDSFPARAGISTESLPVLNRLIQSGVSLPQAVKFIQQPLIEEYLSLVAESKGTLAKFKGEDSSKKQIVDKLLRQYMDSDAVAYYNTKALQDARFAMKLNPTKIISVSSNKPIIEIKAKDYKAELKRNSIKESDVNQISFINETSNPLFVKFNAMNPSLLYKTYHLGEYFWKNTYGLNAPTGEDLRTPESDLEQVALLFEFLNIENQSKGMENFEINFNPDTGLLSTIEGVLERRRFVEALMLDTKVDPETIKRYLDDSVISSMYKTEIFTDIVEPLFALRLDKNLSEMLMRTYEKNRVTIIDRFGPSSSEAMEMYAKEFNNGVIDYIYQNQLSNYVSTKTGLPVDLPEEIRERKVVKKKLSGDNVVEFKEKTVQIDVDQIKKDYKDNAFMIGNDISGNDTFEFSPFATLASYMRYVVEREYFRDTYKEFANSKGFEERISKRALASSFNSGYIMGDAGNGPVKYSYTKDVMEFIEDPANKTIVENFPVLQHLKPSFYMSSRGFNLLSLDNKGLIDNATAAEYVSQLKQLGDATFRIIPEDSVKDRMISDLFKNFSLMAIYQQGTGKSGLSFIKSLDPEPFVQLVKVPAIQFQKSALKDLSNLNKEKRKKEMDKRFSVFNSLSNEILNTDTYKNYLTEPSEFLGSLEAKDLDKRESLSDIDNTNLYIKYRDALGNKKFDDAMSGTLLGTSILNDVENEITRRGLPLISGGVKTMSEEYGIELIQTNPSVAEKAEFTDLIKPQIQAQAIKENKSRNANLMFQYGMRWARVEIDAKPINIKSKSLELPKNRNTEIEKLKKEGKNKTDDYIYAYHELDQNGNPLPSVKTLQPIIDKIQESTNLDMSNYDAVIGNIYLPGQAVATHRDIDESVSAENYPVVVYTIGAGNAINVYENIGKDGKPTGNISFASDRKASIPTKFGTIYTFGKDGKGRFELAHDTPRALKKGETLEPITLPDGRVVKDYTITLTFRRAADLEAGMSITPTTQLAQQTSEVDYNFNPTNVSKEKRDEGKKFVLDILGNPLSVEFESRNEDSLYKFTFKDDIYIETPAKGKMLSYPNGVTNKIVELSKEDGGYDIKFLIGLNKIAEEQPTQQNNTVKSLVNQGQLDLFNTIDPVLETFYNGLNTEESNNTNLPSIEYAQDFYTNAPHAYKNINEYIESLKCL